ncbi:MAG: rhamnulokinase family protein [Salinivirgaceae bacterium]|jgi:rhamnulokinase
MENMHCLAVDMGAGSIRIMLGTVSESAITIEEIYRFKNEIQVLNNSSKWDIGFIYKSIVKGINCALEKNKQITSIGIDSWGVDYALLDSLDNLLELPYSYRDSRTEGMKEKWNTIMSDEETFQRTGINFYPFNTLFQLLSIKGNPNSASVGSILFLPNYIYFKLTGIKFNELTIASSSQLLNVNSTVFDNEILKKLGIKPELLPNIVQPGQVIGQLTDPAIQENNIKAVAVCSHDTASAVAALPALDTDFLYIATGTWCILGIESETPLISNEALQLGITNERGINNTYRVLKNIIGLWLIQGIHKAMDVKLEYSELDQLAANTPETDHLVNPDDSSFYNPENMIEAFNNYFRKTNQSLPVSMGEYINCAYKSLALEFTYYINKFENITHVAYNTLHIIGGGSQSALLCQNTANFSQKLVESGPTESAVLGNIMVQGIAMKKIKDVTEGRKIIANSFPPSTFIPKLSKSKTDIIFNKFLELKKI